MRDCPSPGREGKFGGASRDRTDDLIVANDALSQLSYSPTKVGCQPPIAPGERSALSLYKEQSARENHVNTNADVHRLGTLFLKLLHLVQASG